MLSRREFALGAACAPASLQGQAKKRPNILFATADDRSWNGAFRYRGANTLRIPAIDRVEREGLAFEHSFCAAPSCTASRSSMLTGRQMWQTREGGVLWSSLSPDYPVFTHLLEDAGYFVGSTAKTWGPGTWNALGHKRPPAGREFNTRRIAPPQPGIDPRDYAANFDDFLAARTDKTQPFFFWYGGTEPHRVYENGIGKRLGKNPANIDVPPFWPDTDIVRNDILDYCAEVEYFDTHLGRMLAALERAGELDNTLIVVTSDNGMPFPRGKVNLYDTGIRMPLSIRWGNNVAKPGRTASEFVQHIDFAPTFLDAAGVPIPASMTGKTLLPLLKGERDPSRDAAYAGVERHTLARPNNETYPTRCIRTKDFLYIRNFRPDRWPMGGEHVSNLGNINGDVDDSPTRNLILNERSKYGNAYELCFGKRRVDELYDLKADPWQMRNVSTDLKYSAAKQKLWDRLQSYLRQTGDPRIEGNDPWQSYPYRRPGQG